MGCCADCLMAVNSEVVSLVAKASNRKCSALQLLHSYREAPKQGRRG